MKAGDLVRHKVKSEWGIGVVVEIVSDKCTINFEHKPRVILRVEDAPRHLDDVAPSEVPAGSPLLDKARWARVGGAPAAAAGAKAKRAPKKAKKADPPDDDAADDKPVADDEDAE